MTRTKQKLKQLIENFTKGIGINKDTFKTFVNEEGETMPCCWNVAYNLCRKPKYLPTLRITRNLFDYFNEPYHIKDGAVKIGAEKTVDDEA